MIDTVTQSVTELTTGTSRQNSGVVPDSFAPAGQRQPSGRIQPNYRADIDGLRGLAVLAVVGFHAFPDWVSGGYVGVDVFFVISGYLISTILLRGLDEGTFSFSLFYSRRIRRIFPALLVLLVACYWFGWYALLAEEYTALGKHMAAGAGFVSNLVFWSESGYFDIPGETKPLLHLWSLGVEEQFYIVWPLALWAAWKAKLDPLLVTLGVSVLSFAFNVALSTDHLVQDFYSPATRLWELSLGGALASFALRPGIHSRGHTDADPAALDPLADGVVRGHTPVLRAAASVLGVACIGAAVFGFDKHDAFPGWRALLPTVGTMLLIAAGPYAWISRRVLSNWALVGVGLISYPLYLWHWPLLSFSRIVESATPPPQARIAAIVVAMALAWMTYQLFERPIRFGKASRSTLAVIVLVLGMSAIGLAGYATFAQNGLAFRLHAFEEQIRAIKVVVERTEDCQMAIPISGLRYCMLTDPSRPATVALIGDSHANRLFPPLSRRYAREGDNLLQLGGGGCLPFWDVETGPPGKTFGCDQRMRPQLDYLLSLDSLDTVIMLHRGPYHLEGTEIFTNARSVLIDTRHPEISDRRDVYRRGLDDSLRRFTAAGKKVVIVIDAPEFAYDPTRCISLVRPFAPPFTERPDCRLAKSDVDERNRTYVELSKEAVQRYPTVRLINLQEALCDDRFCYGVQDGRLLYRDADHLNAFGTEYCVERLWEQFRT